MTYQSHEKTNKMAHRYFKTVAKQMYPNASHMQSLVTPEWIAFEMKSSGVNVNPNEIEIEYFDGDLIPCDSEGIKNNRIDVFVNGKKMGTVGPLVVNGKYKGDTFQKI